MEFTPPTSSERISNLVGSEVVRPSATNLFCDHQPNSLELCKAKIISNEKIKIIPIREVSKHFLNYLQIILILLSLQIFLSL